MRLPHVDTTQAQAEKLWRQDRKRLVVCRNSNQAMRLFYEDLRDRLTTPEQ